jgi:hypothetical protein
VERELAAEDLLEQGVDHLAEKLREAMPIVVWDAPAAD